MPEDTEGVQLRSGNYTFIRELGRGGMATVYLAHDEKHDRRVAIKVLHADLAAALGAERFLHEIRITANLQHPHILGLIDSGMVGEDGGKLQGRPYYVMPYVEGESLRARLERERQLPINDSVRIATEVASALDYAHRHAVIHRDIKPENVLLHDGSAIVADFGIALAISEAGGPRLTQTGMSLGTPSYMSPEQATAEKDIGARSDIYSLGAMTYEMLCGEAPFTGPTVRAIVAKVLTEDPRPIVSQRRTVPPNVAAAVSRALEKIPADRFGTAHEFAEALIDPTSSAASQASTSATLFRSAPRQLWYAGGLIAILGILGAVWVWRRQEPGKPVLRYTLGMDSAQELAHVPESYWGSRLALSRDGSRFAYIGGPRLQLFLRERNLLHSTPIPGTEGVHSPFFSPDGQRIGFVKGDRLQIVSLDGTSLGTVADSMIGWAGASWGSDGFIYADGDGYLPLVRVEAKSGAIPMRFTTFDTTRGEFDQLSPDALPNGKAVIFTAASDPKPGSHRPVGALAIAEIPSGRHHILLEGVAYAVYAPPNFIVYVTMEGRLMAVPFDQNSMKLTGPPTPLAEGITLNGPNSPALAASASGILMYSTAAPFGKDDLVWVDRTGQSQVIDADWNAIFGLPSISPDGGRLAITVFSEIGSDGSVWIKELNRGPATKLNGSSQVSGWPTWTPDGQSVTYAAKDSHGWALWTQRADGSTPANLQYRVTAESPVWSQDGKWLVFQVAKTDADMSDILGLRPGVDREPVPLMVSRFSEFNPSLSPDGRWLAYASVEGGRYDVRVVPFPKTDSAKWIISPHGGTEPRWAHSGKELFYRDQDDNMVAVEVKTAPSFVVGASKVLFAADSYRAKAGDRRYDVAPDDKHFLMIRPASGPPKDKLIVVENWFEELKAKPTK